MTTAEPAVTPELAAEHGLSTEEHERVREILGREMTFAELGVFSVMWSEHCSYKNSILLLKTLPREGPMMLALAGEENAGVVDWGDGTAVVFKIESHNHPSALEPYQGAATGVGGILRDIFTMGARPIAALNSLRFGDPNDARVRFLIDGVVRGIGDYGNCFGVPTVGGEVVFEDAYTGNPLVNAMAVGLVTTDKIARAAAEVTGAPVYIVGAQTGRDGIHGATFASEELSEKSAEKRPAVQIGDPFTEKLLLEATLEMIDRDLLVGIQDMGAAGITCSCSEMAFRGGRGIAIDIGKVPVREDAMTPYEILLSESQERMLVIVKPGCEEDMQAVFEKWRLESECIGEVIADNRFVVHSNGQVVVDVPADVLALGGEAPQYKREEKRPAYLDEATRFDANSVTVPSDWKHALRTLLAAPNICDKNWVYHQYDQSVMTCTAAGSGGDAAVIRLRDTDTALAVTTDGNGRYCYLNPRRGARIAVAEAARNLVCSGAEPLAVTNCLNFGNPYDPEMYYLFAECVRGMGEACREFATPVTGGNVSFYNEDPTRAVFPTPVIGMIGRIASTKHITPCGWQRQGDAVYAIGACTDEIGGSEYLRTLHGKIAGDTPELDFERELNVQRFVTAQIRAGRIASAHDCADGGLAVALAESSIRAGYSGAGCQIVPGTTGVRPDAWMFGEAQSRIVISVSSADAEPLEKAAADARVPCARLGVTTDDGRFTIDGFLTDNVAELSRIYTTTFNDLMEAAPIGKGAAA